MRGFPISGQAQPMRDVVFPDTRDECLFDAVVKQHVQHRIHQGVEPGEPADHQEVRTLVEIFFCESSFSKKDVKDVERVEYRLGKPADEEDSCLYKQVESSFDDGDVPAIESLHSNRPEPQERTCG